jgi:hypothetical protein
MAANERYTQPAAIRIRTMELRDRKMPGTRALALG